MVLQHSVRELVELVHEVSNVDTAHRIGLREWHGLRKVLPALISEIQQTWIRFTSTAARALLLAASTPLIPGRIPLDRSPSSVDRRPQTQSDRSLRRISGVRVQNSVQTMQ